MTGYQTGPGNQLLNDGLWTYTFDNEGNEIQKTSGSGEKWKYSYDLLNHLSSAIDINSSGATVTFATYIYDVFGNRIEKDVWTQQSGQTTVSRFGYDGDKAWVDLNSSNALQTRYLRGDSIDELFSRISSAGVPAWYLPDHLGSVRNLTDNTGTLIDTIAYDAYGNVTRETSTTNGDRFKWADLQYDSNTGLNFAKARPEDSSNGRWLEQDPLGFSAGDNNIYRYAKNDPVGHTDPSGLELPYNGYPYTIDEISYKHPLWTDLFDEWAIDVGATFYTPKTTLEIIEKGFNPTDGKKLRKGLAYAWIAFKRAANDVKALLNSLLQYLRSHARDMYTDWIQTWLHTAASRKDAGTLMMLRRWFGFVDLSDIETIKTVLDKSATVMETKKITFIHNHEDPFSPNTYAETDGDSIIIYDIALDRPWIPWVATLIHEITHLAAGTKDNGYLKVGVDAVEIDADGGYYLNDEDGNSYTVYLAKNQQIDNADNYVGLLSEFYVPKIGFS